MRKKVVLEERPTFKEEITKMRKMPASELAWYIWSYYKFHIAVIIGVAFLVFSLIGVAINAGKETVLSGLLLNVTHEEMTGDYLQDTYLDYLDLTKKQAMINVRSDVTINTEGDGGLLTAYNMQLLQALILAGTEDFMICSPEAMNYIQKVSGGIIADLSTALPAETYERFEERGLIRELEYLRFGENGSVEHSGNFFAGAIDITDTPLSRGIHAAEGTEVYLCFFHNSPTPEHFEPMANYVLDYIPE